MPTKQYCRYCDDANSAGWPEPRRLPLPNLLGSGLHHKEITEIVFDASQAVKTQAFGLNKGRRNAEVMPPRPGSRLQQHRQLRVPFVTFGGERVENEGLLDPLGQWGSHPAARQDLVQLLLSAYKLSGDCLRHR
jgi:hypothetical protein